MRQSLPTKPEALTVIEQELEGGARAVAEHVHGALEGIIAETLSANGTEAIDAVSAIDRFGSSKDAALWGELQPYRAAKQL